MKLPFRKKEKTEKRGSLQRRWLRNTVGITSALVVIAILSAAVAVSAYYYSGIESGLEAKVTAATDYLLSSNFKSRAELYVACSNAAASFAEKDILEMQFVDSELNLVSTSYGQIPKSVAETSDLKQAMETGTVVTFRGRNPATDEQVMAVSSPVIYSDGTVIGVLRCISSLHPADVQVLLLTGILLLIGAALLLTVFFSNRYFIRQIVLPVTQINATAKRIAAGSYGVQMTTAYKDEIGELAETINDMSNKIKQSEKTQREFVSSVSHELRTPLTAIAGWGETILADAQPDPTLTRRGVETILRESRRLTDMVEGLLEFTRIEDGRFTLSVEQSDIRAEFEDTVFMYGNRLRQENIQLTYIENEEDIPEIPCDPQRMRQVFLNILDNAAKHGGQGKRITAEILQEGKEVVIRIRDYGPGIPEDELPLIKHKFYKGSSTARGSGIGLAVCEEIVTMHGGKLDITNAEGGGTLVTIRLPVAAA